MNTTASVNHTPRTISYYFEKAKPFFDAIPGMSELLTADHDTYETIASQYPDASFALMTANNLFNHDRELSQIQQTAFFSIVNGENISTVRFRYDREMDAYVKRHNWDD